MNMQRGASEVLRVLVVEQVKPLLRRQAFLQTLRTEWDTREVQFEHVNKHSFILMLFLLRLHPVCHRQKPVRHTHTHTRPRRQHAEPSRPPGRMWTREADRVRDEPWDEHEQPVIRDRPQTIACMMGKIKPTVCLSMHGCISEEGFSNGTIRDAFQKTLNSSKY